MKQTFFTLFLFIVSNHSVSVHSMFLTPTKEEILADKPALHQAAGYNDLEKIKMLITAGADVNEKDERDYTPLHIAAMLGSQEAAELLIKMEADLDNITYAQETPLHTAIIHNQPTLVKSLLTAGANPNIMFSYQSPLHLASIRNSTDIVQMLIDAGADINQTDDILKKNALAGAIDQDIDKYEKSLCILVAKGCHTKKAVRKILEWCGYAKTFQVPPELKRLLCLAGNALLPKSDITFTPDQDFIGATALMYFAAQRNIEYVKYQLKQGANTTIEDNYGRNVFRILTIILNNKDDLELTPEQQATYQKIMRLCYNHLAKPLWCIYNTHPKGLINRDTGSSLSVLPLDILKIIMLFVTSMPCIDQHKTI